MFDRRLLQCFDWGILGLTVLLAIIGLGNLYSAATAGVSQKGLFIKQLIWYGVGFAGMVVSFLVSYKTLERWATFFYLVCVALLMYVLFFGVSAGGSRRWVFLFGFSIQPSEIAKVAVIFVLARYYSKVADARGLLLRELVRPFIAVLIPFVLIVKQPDLGTAMLILLTSASLTCFVKIERRSLIYLLSACMVTVPMVWFCLREYQKQRILTFLDPDRDPLGAGYHIIQSKIAIGSGMVFGKGFSKGTQNVFSFLPEQHTDFIFSVLAEEWGIIGSFVLLSIFIMLIIKGLSIAHKCKDPFGIILSVGITIIIFWECLINVGMVTGLVPVVGVPLPFISYGGSSIITSMISLGLLMNVSMRRFAVD